MSAYHSKRRTGRVGSPIEIDHLAVVGVRGMFCPGAGDACRRGAAPGQLFHSERRQPVPCLPYLLQRPLDDVGEVVDPLGGRGL